MATTLLVNGQPSKPLSTRPATRAGGVRKSGESKDQMQQRLGSYGSPSGSDNSDIDAIFKGIQGTRGMVRRGLSGQPLNPDGTDPGNSFDRFMRQNPHLQGASGRQQQNNQQALGNPSSAVAERRALQEMQQPNPNLVTGNDGYRTLFGPGGKVLGTTKPMARTSDNAINRGTATGAERGQFSQQLQQTGMNSASSPKGLDMLFPGNAKSSPPGGANAGRVGPSQAPGEPGGDTLFGQMPEYKSPGMPVNYNRELGYGPNAGPQQYASGPNEGPQRPADFGPQLPNSSGEQLMALKRLSGFGGNNNPTLTALEGLWSNLFPGNDYDYLQQLFPGLVHPQAGSGQTMTQLAKMYQNPAYQALFPQVNQSEFYK